MKKLLVLSMGSMVLFSCGSNSTTPTTKTDTTKVEVKDTLPTWSYVETGSEMNGKTIVAVLKSNNKVKFKFPYEGGSFSELNVSTTKKYKIINFSISKGQFNSSVEDIEVRIKFDDNKPKTYYFTSPNDGSGDYVMCSLKSMNELYNDIVKSKRMVVELEFYQEGISEFVFNTENLDVNRIKK